MRKLILTAAFILASAAVAHAGQSRGLVLANADTPAQAQPAVAPAQSEAQPAPSQAQPADAPRAQASRPIKSNSARRPESDEAKARRIAARYGVYW
ncbi:hypothetical protein [Bradyrhizobium mercantei]|uniref:hypothetical protein n=1 Tax=Bradyrhizobium mercantei TaxID=1904807 RepID=UPI0009787BD7|nr:hypothetical protein [Bradyrhizobium mercantei]